MMNCREAREYFPWWINESLAPADRRKVAVHLESCDGCRAELGETRTALAAFAHHLPVDVLIEVAADRDPGVDPELLETHLASCRDCAEELALLRESRGAIEDAGDAHAPGRRGALLPWRPPAAPAAGVRWRRLAVAASLAAVLAGLVAVRGWWTASRPAGHGAGIVEARVNVPVVDLHPSPPVLRGGEAAEPSATVPGSSVPVTLLLNSRLPASPEPLVVEIRDAGGRKLLEREGLRPDGDGLFTLSLATSGLPEGELVLNLLRRGPDGLELVEAYRLRVRRDQAPAEF